MPLALEPTWRHNIISATACAPAGLSFLDFVGLSFLEFAGLPRPGGWADPVHVFPVTSSRIWE
eukprot:7815132-Heterocapsa_arctica.AAC.1